MEMFGKLWLAGAVALLPSVVRAAVITFDDGLVAENSTLSTQYTASLGVTFVPGLHGATGIAAPVAGKGAFATNTDMTIVSSAGADIGGGVGAPISGLLLRSYSAWQNSENGDPVFSILFASPITSISVDFGSLVIPAGNSRIIAVDGTGAAIGSSAATAPGTQRVTLTPTVPVSQIVITPGDYNDWVGVDNINFTPVSVPEPTTAGTAAFGVLVLAARRRRA